MQTITLYCHFGEEVKKVEVSQPFGGGGQYHLYIDRFYQGSIFKRGNEWVTSAEQLTIDDIQILGAIIELHEKKAAETQ